MNNQPFFRHERVARDMVVQASSRPALDMLCTALTSLDQLNADDSLEALAAFLRVRISVGAVSAPDLGEGVLGVLDLAEAATNFITRDPEGGKRGQAFLAACLSLVFDDVTTSRVNDPSRHVPGDAGVFEGESATLAAEAKQRPASRTEVLQFVARCRVAGVSRALLAALDPSQGPLDVAELRRLAWRENKVHLSLVQGAADLLRAALAWTTRPLDDALRLFPHLMAARLEELEVSANGQRAWADLFDETPR